MCENDYPEKFLKGAPSVDFYDTDNGIMQYQALEKWDVSEGMEGFEESSINWFDGDGALDELRSKTKEKDGKSYKQFKGCFVLSTEELRICVRRHEKLLAFRRDPLPGNPYHGNIYRKKDLPKQTRITLMSQLCNAFIEFVSFEETAQ